MSVTAFHERAGRSQVDSFVFSLDTIFLFCRVATDAILPSALLVSDLSSLGASWAFSLQPVLLPVRRPCFPSIRRKWARPLTQSPELGFGIFFFPSLEDFDFYAAAGIAA